MADLDALVIQLQLETSQLQKGLSDAQGKIKQFGDAAGKTAEPLKKSSKEAGGFGAKLGGMLKGAAIVAVMYELAHAAAADAESFAVFQNQLQNTTGATKAQVQATDDQLASMGEVAGVAQGTMRNSFQKLLMMTGDQTKAMKLQKLALDVAAGAHVPVTKAAMALGRAVNGSTGALVRLDPKLKGSTHMLADVQKQFKGAAKAAGDANPFTRLGLIMERIKIVLGRGLLPIFAVFGQILIKIMPFVSMLGDLIGKVVAKFMPFISQLAAKLMPVLAKVVKIVMHLVEKVMPFLSKVISKLVMPVIDELIKILDGGLLDMLMQVIDAVMELADPLMDVLMPVISSLIDIVDMLWVVLKPILDIVIVIAKFVIRLVILALKPLQKEWEIIQRVLEQKVKPAFDKMGKALKPLADIVQKFLVVAFKDLMKVLDPLWKNVIKPIIDGLMSLLGIKADTSVSVKVKPPKVSDVKKAVKASLDGAMMSIPTDTATGKTTSGGKTTKTKAKTGHTINTTVNAKTDASAHLIAAQVVNAIKFNLPVAGDMGGGFGGMGSQVAHG